MQKAALTLPMILSACGGGGVETTSSGFRVPLAGEIPVELVGEQNGRTIADFGTAVYATGTNENGAQALAGLEDLGSVGPMPTATSRYTSLWEVIGIEDISGSGSAVDGTNFTDNGSIELVLDPSNGTVTGVGPGTLGSISVNGNVSSGDIGGSMSYRGVNGVVDGIIGESGAIAAFHGNSGSLVYAGGIRSLSVAQ